MDYFSERTVNFAAVALCAAQIICLLRMILIWWRMRRWKEKEISKSEVDMIEHYLRDFSLKCRLSSLGPIFKKATAEKLCADWNELANGCVILGIVNMGVSVWAVVHYETLQHLRWTFFASIVLIYVGRFWAMDFENLEEEGDS